MEPSVSLPIMPITVSRELRLAGPELVLAISDLVLDGTVVADPATIADRVDLSRAVSNIAGAIDARHQVSLFLLDAALDLRSRVDDNATQVTCRRSMIAPCQRPGGRHDRRRDSLVTTGSFLGRHERIALARARISRSLAQVCSA